MDKLKAQSILDSPQYTERIAPKGDCTIWHGPRYKLNPLRSPYPAQPVVHIDRRSYNVRRLARIAAGLSYFPHQRHAMTCGERWCVNVDHIKVNREVGVIEAQNKRGEMQRAEWAALRARRAKEFADRVCIECGEPRGQNSNWYCAAHAKIKLTRNSNISATANSKYMGPDHLRNVYRARKFREQLAGRTK